MNKVSVFILLASTFITTSCATLFTGTKDRISFNSTPSGAIVYKNGVEMCKTPCSINVNRNINDTDVELKLDGYETRIITLDKSFNVVSILNLTNLLGWAIDALTGSVYKYDRKAYDITLSKRKSVSSILPKRINIDESKKTVDVYVVAQ